MTELTIDASHESYDPLDEILALFRANTFFRNFEIKGPADRVLIYGILFVSEVLSKIKPNLGRRDAEKVRWISIYKLGKGPRAVDWEGNSMRIPDPWPSTIAGGALQRMREPGNMIKLKILQHCSLTVCY